MNVELDWKRWIIKQEQHHTIQDEQRTNVLENFYLLFKIQN